MPNYKTHSIHSDKVFPYLDKRIDIDKEDLKVFSFGPDSLAFSDVRAFNEQHDMNSKSFFECLLYLIKTHKYYTNKEMIAFLYGQIEHFILDITFHPYIYYVTPSMKNQYLTDNHANFELWLDDYFMNKYGIKDKNYFSRYGIRNKYMRVIIDYVYRTIYNCLYASNKYDLGINMFLKIEDARTADDKIISSLSKAFRISDISYDDVKRIEPYLNKERTIWYNPFTLESHKESLNELWNKSVELFLQTIEDVNKYLYDGRELRNSLVNQNISYDTGIDCNIKKRILACKCPNKEVQS